MKTLTLSIDLKSFFMGALTVGGLLILANFKPAGKPALEPTDEIRRYQAVSSEHGNIIVDTKTGQFILNPSYMGNPRWIKGDFETIQTDNKK